MKLAKVLTEYLESSRLEITKFDYANKGDLVLIYQFGEQIRSNRYAAYEYEYAVSAVPLFHVRKVPKYRPVKIDDLGKECEFSDYMDFRLAKIGLFVECRRDVGPFGFGMASQDKVEHFPFCRTVDEN